MLHIGGSARLLTQELIEQLIVVLPDYHAHGVSEEVQAHIVNLFDPIFSYHHRVVDLAGLVQWLERFNFIDFEGLGRLPQPFRPLDGLHWNFACQPLHVIRLLLFAR